MSLRRPRNISFGQTSNYVIWSGVEIGHSVGTQKYVIWSGVEICHLVGRRNISFWICHLVGHWNRSYGNLSNRASKFVNCVEICHLVVGRRNMSFGGASKYVIRKYGIWSGVEICHLVGQQKMSLGLASE